MTVSPPLAAPRRATVVVLLAGAVVLLSALVGPTPLVDAETGRAVHDATLATPATYVVLAPLCTTLDALTALSVQQHIALLLSAIALFVLWRMLRRPAASGVGRGRALPWRMAHEVALGAIALAIWLGVYALGALVPRPMAAIRLRDPDAIAVDFHSHTDASWDARRSFDAAANRAWHAGGGFDAAYVSDHGTYRGARLAAPANPLRAGLGVTLLPAVEVRDHGVHINVLGVRPPAGDTIPGEWDERTVADPANPPITLLTIPGRLSDFPSGHEWSPARFVAVELADASPKGITEEQRDRARILHLADSLDLATVAGSDNHGWGRTAVAWSVLRIPGWRDLPPAALDRAIRGTLQRDRRYAVRVLERDAPRAGVRPVALAVTAPALVWTLVRNLSRGERVSWCVWLAIGWGVAAVTARRGRRAG